MTRIFFCSDIHGSTKCWRKIVSAGEFYKVDHVILGGDMTGKAIIPIVKESDGTYTSSFLGRKWVLRNEKELEEHTKLVVNSGWYIYKTGRDELEDLKDKKSTVDQIFKEKVIERVREWMEIAEVNLKPKNRKIIVAPGNDDHLFIDPLFEGSDVIIDVESKILSLDKHHEMLSSGWSNPTPWQTPRECSEEELARKIDLMASQINNVENSVFNLHVPPFGSGLDTAPKLKENLQITASGETAPVGSTAVLNAIKKYQPMLGLHGHIHEALGRREIGRTLCVNPGSNYTEGILNGVIIAFDERKVKSAVFTTG
jgi:Icc-related predicted phosphoesterase